MSNNIQPPDKGITPDNIQLAGRWKPGAVAQNTDEASSTDNTDEARSSDQARSTDNTDEFPKTAHFHADKVPYYLVFGEEGKKGNLRNLDIMSCFPCSCPTFADNANNPVHAHAKNCALLAAANSTIVISVKFVHCGGKDGNEDHFAILGPIVDVPAANVVAAYCTDHNLRGRVLVLRIPTSVVNSPMWQHFYQSKP